ncbi:pentapeptide repeat-containing protein [Streptomyces sp. NBC_01803]|uniref:pentapeptide repeat-containing protein n=1 Tax=Streptomyces sp. NBC_01803 TaxID=2975946 RepID=UPI002DDB8C43|nr:pentapeptide repeat-containing protein [Streptomyces sp. NBC_01803]
MPGHTACLAHLDEPDRIAYLGGLTPGAEIDHRSTPFTDHLLDQLLTAVRDPATGRPHLGVSKFEGATFLGDAEFVEVTFSGDARFDGATFSGVAGFEGVIFSGDARFEGATFSSGAGFAVVTFSGDAWFNRVIFSGGAGFLAVTFSGDARFDGATFSGGAPFLQVIFSGGAVFLAATFSGDAGFGGVIFSGDARFEGATFSGGAGFEGATFSGGAGFEGVIFPGVAGFGGVIFSGDARFRQARFEVAQRVGPVVCRGTVNLDGAVFGAPVTVEIAVSHVSLRRTRWESTAALRLRYAEVDLAGAVLEYPLTLAAEPAPPSNSRGTEEISEDLLLGRDPGVRIASLSGVDAAHLALTDVDLSGCHFAGAVHLDQLRLDGRVRFARPPVGWHRRGLWPARWSRRRTLAEEHHWRAAVSGQSANVGLSSDRLWRSGEHHPDLQRTPGPESIAALYRQLRKALEDGKNEPGAADFYYGEMEMRRHDRDPDGSTPLPERLLLHLYWAVSGYGLRASRALAWLGAAMTVTVAVMMLWGLPADDPKPTTTGRQVEAGQRLALTTDTPAPVNPIGPLHQRLSTDRFEKSLRTVINSTVFRSSGQDLTTAGTYVEMTSRLVEPVLLGLAVLAIRARVKR